MTGKEHAKLLGLFFWLLTALQVLTVGFIGIFYLFFAGFMINTMPHKAGDPPPELILSIIVAVVVVLLVMTILMAIPKIIAGYGLRKEKSWAKVWAIVASVMACMNVPLGTAVGVYGLIFILGDNGKAYFDGTNYGRQLNDGVGTAYTPTPNSWQQQ